MGIVNTGFDPSKAPIVVPPPTIKPLPALPVAVPITFKK